MTRAAIESLAGVERVRMCGTRATFTTIQGAVIHQEELRAALEERDMTFESLTKELRPEPAATWRAAISGVG